MPSIFHYETPCTMESPEEAIAWCRQKLYAHCQLFPRCEQFQVFTIEPELGTGIVCKEHGIVCQVMKQVDTGKWVVYFDIARSGASNDRRKEGAAGLDD